MDLQAFYNEVKDFSQNLLDNDLREKINNCFFGYTSGEILGNLYLEISNLPKLDLNLEKEKKRILKQINHYL